MMQKKNSNGFLQIASYIYRWKNRCCFFSWITESLVKQHGGTSYFVRFSTWFRQVGMTSCTFHSEVLNQLYLYQLRIPFWGTKYINFEFSRDYLSTTWCYFVMICKLYGSLNVPARRNTVWNHHWRRRGDVPVRKEWVCKTNARACLIVCNSKTYTNKQLWCLPDRNRFPSHRIAGRHHIVSIHGVHKRCQCSVRPRSSWGQGRTEHKCWVGLSRVNHFDRASNVFELGTFTRASSANGHFNHTLMYTSTKC